MNTVTITISGPAHSGRSFLKHQIAKHLSSIAAGIKVSVDESELNTDGVLQRMYHPDSFVTGMARAGVSIRVVEVQTSRGEQADRREGANDFSEDAVKTLQGRLEALEAEMEQVGEVRDVLAEALTRVGRLVHKAEEHIKVLNG